MNIYHFEVSPEDQILLKDQGQTTSEVLNTDNVNQYQNAEIISVFVGSSITKEVVDALPNLKLIAARSTGFDHIDCQYAQSKNITVVNVPAYGSRTVAEFAFALILGLSRKIFQANFRIKTEQDFDYDGFGGFNLQGKTLGIVGTGRIGQEVAKLSKGFEVNILAFDAFPNTEVAKQLGFKYVSLNELLEQSDIVTLHVPYNKDTHHLINNENINNIKKGAILVNTSRGEVIDTAAILHGVESGLLSGVGLDVLEGEHELKDEMKLLAKNDNMHKEQIKTLLEDHVLMGLPQVIITPHMAFYTQEAKAEIVRITLENIAAFIAGEPKNIIKA